MSFMKGLRVFRDLRARQQSLGYVRFLQQGAFPSELVRGRRTEIATELVEEGADGGVNSAELVPAQKPADVLVEEDDSVRGRRLLELRERRLATEPDYERPLQSLAEILKERASKLPDRVNLIDEEEWFMQAFPHMSRAKVRYALNMMEQITQYPLDPKKTRNPDAAAGVEIHGCGYEPTRFGDWSSLGGRCTDF
uniref:Succinate dehydrogenase assembly factor 4, mitochondrial n=1 Tax=Rhodosorus marinus TaxID=101924 RepID=A0A7S0BJF0_9RHOD|mmetsp:Transcript_19083/g.27653  ORF Transcript_19083/g.27653 Transcript_19083/m.27653 type:complete len:195 (+) Transcript_19083:96-680(+)